MKKRKFIFPESIATGFAYPGETILSGSIVSNGADATNQEYDEDEI